jgi:hypothetical protein
LFGLASMFPLLRPDCPEFDAWLDARQATEITRELIEEGGALLPAAERERIAHAHGLEFPEVWGSLVADLGDEADADQVVVVGAVVAALAEARRVDPDILELVEHESEGLGADSPEALALALEPTDLWSIAEAAVADDALAEIPDTLDDDAYAVLWGAVIEAQAAQLWSPRHERRLARLVQGLRARLAVAQRPAAFAVLTEACAAFEREEDVRTKVASLLLAGSLDSLQQAQIPAAVAA